MPSSTIRQLVLTCSRGQHCVVCAGGPRAPGRTPHRLRFRPAKKDSQPETKATAAEDRMLLLMRRAAP